jgi:STE24 endopeptidase
MNLLSRKNEYEADAFAHDLGYNRDLKSALVKIHIENLGNLIPDKWYSAYHASHPSLVERLQALSKLARKSD